MYNYYNPNVNQYPGYMGYQNMPVPNSPSRQTDIIKVNGRNGAEAFQMAPNSRVLLLDETEPVIWFCQTDGAGFKTILGYDITPKEEIPKKDELKLLEERIEALEVKVNESNTASNEQKSKSTK